jgi:hypothetical protein
VATGKSGATLTCSSGITVVPYTTTFLPTGTCDSSGGAQTTTVPTNSAQVTGQTTAAPSPPEAKSNVGVIIGGTILCCCLLLGLSFFSYSSVWSNICPSVFVIFDSSAIGGAVVVIALIAGLAFWTLCGKNRKKNQDSTDAPAPSTYSTAGIAPPLAQPASPPISGSPLSGQYQAVGYVSDSSGAVDRNFAPHVPYPASAVSGSSGSQPFDPAKLTVELDPYKK